MSPCLSDLPSYFTHGANGVCGPPEASLAALALFVLGVLGLLGLWSRRSRSAILLFALFALPGWWAIVNRHIDGEPITRLRTSIEKFADAHARCVTLETKACEVCEPIARRARTPSVACVHPAVVELQAGALDGHCAEHGDRLVCGPN